MLKTVLIAKLAMLSVFDDTPLRASQAPEVFFSLTQLELFDERSNFIFCIRYNSREYKEEASDDPASLGKSRSFDYIVRAQR